jgi:MFS family permease
VRNYLNPLADNFTIGRFASGLIFGASLPIVIAFAPPGLIERLGARAGLPSATAWTVAEVIAFALSGVVVGSLFRAKSFIWAILLGYLPLFLLGVRLPGQVFMTLLMAIVADAVTRARAWRERLA